MISMLIRNPRAIIATILVLTTVGFTVWLKAVVSERDRLRVELTDERRKVIVKQIEIDQLQESIEVYRVFREQQIDRDRQFNELVRNLEQVEGANETLSPFMRDAADRLFGKP